MATRNYFSDKELMRYFNNEQDMGLNIQLAELQKPTAPFVMRVYQAAVSYMDMCEDLSGLQRQLPEYQNLQYPELHSYFVQIQLLAAKLNTLFELIGCHLQFEVSDLMTPVAQRSRIFFSELIVFLDLAPKYIKDLEGVAEDQVNRAKQKEELQETRDKLKNEYMEEMAKDGMRKDLLKNFDARMNSAQDEVKKLTNDLQNQGHLKKELELEHEDLKDRIKTRQGTKDSKISIQRSVEAQLVSSPDRLHEELTEKQAESEAVSRRMTEREATLENRKAIVAYLKVFTSGANQAKEKTKKITKIVKDGRHLENIFEALQLEHQQFAAVYKECEEEFVKANDEQGEAKQKLANIQVKQANRMKQLSNTHDSYLQDRERLEELLFSTEDRTRELSQEKEDFELDKVKRSENEAEMRAIFSKMHELEVVDTTNLMLTEVEDYVKKLVAQTSQML